MKDRLIKIRLRFMDLSVEAYYIETTPHRFLMDKHLFWDVLSYLERKGIIKDRMWWTGHNRMAIWKSEDERINLEPFGNDLFPANIVQWEVDGYSMKDYLQEFSGE